MASTAHDIGALTDFDEGRPYRLTIDRRALLIVRQDHTVYALRDTCPHQGARLSDGVISGTTLPCLPGQPIRYGRQGHIVVCPWHGWEFDLTDGTSLVDPDHTRVRAYTTQVIEGRVFITFDRPSAT